MGLWSLVAAPRERSETTSLRWLSRVENEALPVAISEHCASLSQQESWPESFAGVDACGEMAVMVCSDAVVLLPCLARWQINTQSGPRASHLCSSTSMSGAISAQCSQSPGSLRQIIASDKIMTRPRGDDDDKSDGPRPRKKQRKQRPCYSCEGEPILRIRYATGER